MSFIPVPEDDDDGSSGEGITFPEHDTHDHTGVPGVGGGGSGTGFTEVAPDQWVFQPTDPVAIAVVATNGTTSSIFQVSADASAALLTTADGSMAQVQALGAGSTAQLTAPAGTAEVTGADVEIEASTGDLTLTDPVGSITLSDIRSKLRDFDKAGWTGGNLTLNSVAWANLPTVGTALDLQVAAEVGDEIEVGLSAYWIGPGTTEWGMLDVATIVANTPVNYFSSSTGTPAAEGIPAWEKTGAPQEMTIGGTYWYTVQAGDLSSGTVTLRLRYKTANAVNHTVSGTASRGIQFTAKNLGQRP